MNQTRWHVIESFKRDLKEREKEFPKKKLRYVPIKFGFKSKENDNGSDK